MYVSLYRRYRPQTFKEVVGQAAAVDVLCAALAEARIGHAYLFSGPRGCGKTTAARLVAKALNCENPVSGEPCCRCDSCLSVVAGKHLDVIEIDGASNRGIDEIRELKSHVSLSPFMGHKKIYIIDEAHMLTDAASNALLKTLEEPPPSVVFILATTESHKVSVTIRSRCQHIPFHRIGAEDIVAHLAHLAQQEGVAAEERALWELARAADGALRDALSLMEQALAAGHGTLTMACVRDLMGGGSRKELEEWARLLRSNPGEASALLTRLLALGIPPERFLEGLFSLFRDLWLHRLWGDSALAGLSLSPEELSWLRDEASLWEVSQLKALCLACSKLMPRVRYGMRNDVFSGMLQLAFAEALLGKEEPEAKIEKKAEKPTEIKIKKEIKAVEREERIARRAPRSAVEVPSGLSPLFVRLWAEDLHLCAALLRAKIVRQEDAWALEMEGLSKNERMTLELDRASIGLSRAIAAEWNIQPPQTEPMEESAPPPERESERSLFQPNNSVEQLAAYLDAEVLLVKPKSTAAGDIENIAGSVSPEEEIE